MYTEEGHEDGVMGKGERKAMGKGLKSTRKKSQSYALSVGDWPKALANKTMERKQSVELQEGH